MAHAWSRPFHRQAGGMRMDHSPTVRGRRLMREVKRLREASGLSPDEAAQRLDFSKSKLYRIENGRSRIDADDLEDMLDLYDVRSPDRDALVALGRDSRRRGWWTTYKDVFTGSYVGLESEAARIRVASHIVPGLFQTADYARAVISETRPMLDPGEAERRVVARTARQNAVLGRDNPPEVHIVLDEAALHRMVGGAAVAFPDPEDPPVAYAEGLFGDLYLESKEELDRYSLAWTNLLDKALSPAESLTMISTLVKENR